MIKTHLNCVTSAVLSGVIVCPSVYASVTPLTGTEQVRPQFSLIGDPLVTTPIRPQPERVMLAHAILVKSNPEKEAAVSTAPNKVDLWFDDAVGRKYQALAVTNSKGKRVDNKDVRQDSDDRSHLSATVKPMEPGKYRVRYRVQAKDGHILTGKYYFTLTAEGQ